jgi:hypothetical protein
MNSYFPRMKLELKERAVQIISFDTSYSLYIDEISRESLNSFLGAESLDLIEHDKSLSTKFRSDKNG